MKRSSSFSLAFLFLVAAGGCATAVAPSDGAAKPVTHADDDAGTYDNYGGSGTDDDAGSTSSNGSGTDAGGATNDAGAGTDAGTKTDAGSTNTAAPLPSAGEIVVSEVMYNPSGSEPDEEWFEITNLATGSRSLNGLTLADGSGNSTTVSSGSPIVVPANGVVVLARNKTVAMSAGVPGSAIVYQYALLTLANGTTGGLTIKNGSTTLASVPFGQWTEANNGESIELKVTSAPTTPGSWCFAPNTWASGSDYGTPGQASDCP